MEKPCERCNCKQKQNCVCYKWNEYFKAKWNETVKPFRQSLERYQKANESKNEPKK